VGLVHRFVAAWNGHDAAALASLFADDADFVNVVGLWWRNRADIEQAHAYGFERIFGASSMRLVETRVRDLADVAVVHARWELDGQVAPDGRPAARRRGVLVLVAVRDGGRWVAVTAQNTNRVPGAETLLTEHGRARAVTYRTTRE
jgi:uncharacterized protein (TIGR02246 family)